MELSNLNGYSAVINPVPIQRIIDRLESYMSRKDYEGAEKHLLYWLKEAKLGHDTRGELLICNELVGFFRKTDHREQAFKFGDQALNLVNELGLEGSISAGTTYINVATSRGASPSSPSDRGSAAGRTPRCRSRAARCRRS